MTPLVSILIPCHNAAPWLVATLESALSQTHPSCEIIVIDDGSTDGSDAIALSYRSRGVKTATQTQGGASAARNHARRLARGDYIQYLDADDLLHPDKIARQVAVAQKLGPDFLYSGEWARFTASPSDALFSSDVLWSDLSPTQWQILALSGNLMVQPGAWLVPRQLDEAAGDWNETLSLNDDGEFFSRVRFQSRGIVFCSGSKCYYRSGVPGSLSSPATQAALESAFHSHQLIQELLLKHENSPQSRQACSNAWMHYACVAAPRAPALYQIAVSESLRMGCAHIAFPGGISSKIIARLLGWKIALNIQYHLRRIGPIRTAASQAIHLALGHILRRLPNVRGRHRFQRWWVRPRNVPQSAWSTTPSGQPICCDLSVPYEAMVWLRHEEMDDLNYLQHLLGPGQSFVDIGANIGLWTLDAAACVGSSGRVFAFEPNPQTFVKLRQNVAASPFRRNITLRAMALSGQEGTLPFYCPAQHNNAHISNNISKDTVPVLAGILDHALPHLDRLDGIKMDVEGHEADVLRGAVDLFKRFRPWIVLEFNTDIARCALWEWEPHQQLLRWGYEPHPMPSCKCNTITGTFHPVHYANLLYRPKISNP